MHTDRYIISSCRIIPNAVFKNDRLVFERAGDPASFLDDVYTAYGIAYPKYHKMDSLCKLGFLATEILLQDIPREVHADTQTGIVLSNAHASLDVDLKYVKTIASGASPALFVYTLPNIVIGEIAIRHHFTGENAFFVFKKFDGNFMASYVNGLFDDQLINSCICGWVDFFKTDYGATLFYVRGERGENVIPFTPANMNQLNLKEHG